MKNILLFSTGLSPQVVTESIYYHTQIRKPSLRIDAIHIITDAKCEPLVIKELLPDNNGWLLKLADDYQIDPNEVELPLENIHILKDSSGRPLMDLLTVKENNAAVETVFRIVKDLTCDNQTRLITSVAGGRKSMSVIVGQAMQFYAREQDLLTHVIVEDCIIGANDFFYPTPISKKVKIKGKIVDYHDVIIHLDEIPFIRLRSILGNFLMETTENSLISLVKSAQQQIEDMLKPVKIIIDQKAKHLSISGEVVKLPAKSLAIYTLLLKLGMTKFKSDNNEPRFILAEELILEDSLFEYLKIYESMYKPGNIYVDNERAKISNHKDRQTFFTLKWLQETRSKINAVLKKKLSPQVYSFCQIHSTGVRNSTHYGIPIHPQYITIKNQG
ncbi:MAG: TIGR02584 family CRISPR-associated protein [Cytophagia bacterium]|jgi:CRISPR-associated protein (TIGR02584 family)|nr:TIGR02584 family CRISPR-associated protein [Cytophagia bacterium]